MAKQKKEPAQPRTRAKQTLIPGAEPDSIPAIDEVAEQYVMFRDARMQNLVKEIEEGDKLQALMIEHKLKIYEFDGQIVTLAETIKVKVKKKKEKAATEGTEEESEEADGD
jgi:hypothetical protein